MKNIRTAYGFLMSFLILSLVACAEFEPINKFGFGNTVNGGGAETANSFEGSAFIINTPPDSDKMGELLYLLYPNDIHLAENTNLSELKSPISYSGKIDLGILGVDVPKLSVATYIHDFLFNTYYINTVEGEILSYESASSDPSLPEEARFMSLVAVYSISPSIEAKLFLEWDYFWREYNLQITYTTYDTEFLTKSVTLSSIISPAVLF